MEYQKRDPFFANRYIRLMTKSAAGMEITAEGIALCAIIVMQEDSNRYSGPVNFWNSQLCSIMGIPGDENRFRRIREKCVREKWIHYTAGAKSKAARYFATIPDHLTNWDDVGCSENEQEKKHNPDTIPTQSRHNPAENLPRICRESDNILPIPLPLPAPTSINTRSYDGDLFPPGPPRNDPIIGKIDDEGRWRLEVQNEVWAQEIKKVTSKIGAKNWTQWKTIHDGLFKGDTKKLTEFINGMSAEKRWPDDIQTEYSKRRPDAVAELKGRKVHIL
jgi:hypothetical protein